LTAAYRHVVPHSSVAERLAPAASEICTARASPSSIAANSVASTMLDPPVSRPLRLSAPSTVLAALPYLLYAGCTCNRSQDGLDFSRDAQCRRFLFCRWGAGQKATAPWVHTVAGDPVATSDATPTQTTTFARQRNLGIGYTVLLFEVKILDDTRIRHEPDNQTFGILSQRES